MSGSFELIWIRASKRADNTGEWNRGNFVTFSSSHALPDEASPVDKSAMNTAMNSIQAEEVTVGPSTPRGSKRKRNTERGDKWRPADGTGFPSYS